MLSIFLQAQSSGMSSIIMIALMFGGFYFLMIRPQQKKQKQEKQFQLELTPGTRVVTTSGIHGKIFSITSDGVVIETMAGKIKFEKAAISRELTQARFGNTDDKKANDKTTDKIIDKKEETEKA